MKKRVFVIGLDGATFRLLRPWIDEGRLPNLANFTKEGSYGDLESTPEKMSPAAWTSFSTGTNPGKHGIFHFFSIDPGTFKVRINNSTYRDGNPFWNYIGNAGKKVCVVNVPSTYPSDKVNGCMVSGWDAPSIRSEGFTHPPELINEIIKNFHDYPLTPTIKKYTISQPELAIKDMHRVLDLRISLSKYLLSKECWDLFVTVFTETDQVQHHFWHVIDKSHPMYSEAMAKRYSDAIFGIYKKCDSFIGELIESCGKETTIMVVSDHGAGINCLGKHYMPVWLERIGLLKTNDIGAFGWLSIKRRLYGRVRSLISYENRQKIKKIFGIEKSGFDPASMLEEMSFYDWSKTKVYPADSNLRINLKGRQVFGIVSPGAEYEEVSNCVISMLKRSTDLKTGRKIVKEALKKEEAYRGKYVEDAPDIIIKWADDFVLSGISCKAEDGSKIAVPELSIPIEWTGEHSDQGIFMAKGPGIIKGLNVTKACITDIPPTIIYQMGLPIPEGMDGMVLTEIFNEKFLKVTPPKSLGADSPSNTQRKEYSIEEAKEVEERLKNLGYL